MNITKFWKRTLIGGAAALALAAGLIMVSDANSVYAQDAPDTPDNGAWFGRGGRFDGMHEGHLGPFGGDRMSARQSRLADALGISVEALEAAQDEAHAAAIADAVANGDITQEQADLMAAHKALHDYVDHEAVMAEALGVSVEELEAAQADGTLRDLIRSLDLDRGAMAEQMQAAMDEAVSQAVADGVITQEQADQLRAMGGERGFGPGGFGDKDFGKHGRDGRGFGERDGEGRDQRGPGGFSNRSDG